MRFLFLFMDGIGFGPPDPETNPFAAAAMPNLTTLLGGRRLVSGVAPLETDRSPLLERDAGLGMPGLPQSASGQAALVTGKNVPQLIGEHYGPKPTQQIAGLIKEDNLFIQLQRRGYRAALLNAYPQRYFDGVESGRRLLSAIPLAVTSAGLALKTAEDLYAGEAFSVDFTGRGWREQLGYKDAPLLAEAGAGEQGLILVTSDHGNLEDLSPRHHTNNPVPGLVIGAKALRQRFCQGLKDLCQITPAILHFYPPRD